MSKLKLLLRGSAAQIVESVVGIVIGFITLPLMQSHLGGELYGLWILVGGFTAILYIFDFGFASSIIQGVAKSVANKDSQKTNLIINSALLVYTLMSICIVLVVLVIAYFFTPEVDDVISQRELQWVIFIVGLSIAIEFPFKAFAGLSQAYLRFDKAAIYRISVKLSGFLVLVILLHYGYQLIAIAMMGLFFGVVSNFLFLKLARSVFKDLKITRSCVDLNLIKSLFSYSSWSFFIDINSILKGRIDIFFIGGYISLTAVSIYYVPVRLIEYALDLSFKALNLGMPILSGNVAQGDDEKFYENLVTYNRLNVFCSSLGLMLFMIFGEAIIYYWMGADFDYANAYQVLMILFFGRISTLATNGFATALYAKALHRQLAFNTMGETIFTAILLYIFLVKLEMGVIMAALSVSAPLLISRLLILPYMTFRVLKTLNAYRAISLSYRPFFMLLIFIPVYLLFESQFFLQLRHLFLLVVCIAICIGYLAIDLQQAEKRVLHELKSGIIRKINGNRA